MSKKEKYNFTTPLHLACSDDDLRPALGSVYFIDGYAYASNGYMIVKQTINYHTVINPENLNGKTIHRDSFKQIMDFGYATAEEDGISCKDDDGREAFFPYSQISSPTDFASIMPPIKLVEKSVIGLTPKFLAVAAKVLSGAKQNGFKVSMIEGEKICITTPFYDSQMVIIALMLIQEGVFD